jgi:hypothetical protein
MAKLGYSKAPQVVCFMTADRAVSALALLNSPCLLQALARHSASSAAACSGLQTTEKHKQPN